MADLGDWAPTDEQIEALKPAAAFVKPKFAAIPPEVLAQIMQPPTEERKAANLARYQAADADGDGRLSKAEFITYWKAGAENMKAEHGHAIELTDEEISTSWDGANLFTPDKDGLDLSDIRKMRMTVRKINE